MRAPVHDAAGGPEQPGVTRDLGDHEHREEEPEGRRERVEGVAGDGERERSGHEDDGDAGHGNRELDAGCCAPGHHDEQHRERNECHGPNLSSPPSVEPEARRQSPGSSPISRSAAAIAARKRRGGGRRQLRDDTTRGLAPLLEREAHPR